MAGLNLFGTAGRHVVRQLFGAEQRDQRYGNDQHCGNYRHLPGAVEKGTHDVRPAVRAGHVLTGRVYDRGAGLPSPSLDGGLEEFPC